MKTSPKGAVAVFAGVLALAGGLGWLLYEAGGSSSAETERGAIEDPDNPGPARRVHSKPEPPQELPPGPLDRPNEAKPIPKEGRLRFEFEGHPDLALRDWAEAAAAHKAMMELLVEMSEKGVPKPDDEARMERVRKVSQRFQKAVFERPPGSMGMPRVTSLEHPVFVVNLLAAALDRDRLPLTDTQSRRLVDLAKEHGPKYEEAMAATEAPDPAAWTLEVFSAPAAVLERFFGEVHAALTPAQSAALVPEILRNRLRTDFFCAGGAWGRVAQQRLFSSDTELVDTITNGLAHQFGLLERKEELRAIVDEWVRTAPGDAPDAMDRQGFVRTRIVARAVPRMLELLKRIVEVMKLPEESAAEVRKVPRAYVPLRR